MKKLFLIFLAISFNQISFAHKEWVHQHLAIEAYKLLKMRYPGLTSSIMETRIGTQTQLASPDLGSWIGVRVGVQTNGGNLAERWAVAGMYEWRFSKVFSVPVEFYLFRDRGYVFNEIGHRQKVFETLPILSVGLKIRFGFRTVNAYVQGGMEYISGSGFFLTTPNYAVGIEFFLTEKISLYSNIHKNIIPDYRHFITIGTNIKIDTFIRSVIHNQGGVL